MSQIPGGEFQLVTYVAEWADGSPYRRLQEGMQYHFLCWCIIYFTGSWETNMLFCHSSYSSNSFCLKYSTNTLTLYTVCSMLPLIHTQLKGGNALLLMYLNKLEQIVKLHSLTSFTSLSILKDCTYWSVPACSSTGLCWKRDLNLSKTLSK